MCTWHHPHDHHPRPPHHRFHRSLILIGLVLLLLPLLLGTVATAATTTYKWREDRGQLHLTDTPPPPGVHYEEVTSAGRPTSSSTTAPVTSQAPAVTDATKAPRPRATLTRPRTPLHAIGTLRPCRSPIDVASRRFTSSNC